MVKYWFDYSTVIVTGASSGLGRDITMRLVKEHNCRVIGIARSRDKLENVKNELGEKEYLFTYKTFDVSLRENWDKLAEELDNEGVQIDMLINNAGVLPRFDKFYNYTVEDFDKVMQINFYSSIYSMKALMDNILRSRKAAIVNVSSAAALCSFAGTGVYSASKAALKSFTDAVREEHRGDMYVGLICPGFTKTDIFRSQKKSDSTSQKMMDMVSTDCDKMVDMIMNGILKKKEDMIFGMDAHLMNIGYKTLGTLCCNLSSKVMKLSGLEIFKDVFAK